MLSVLEPRTPGPRTGPSLSRTPSYRQQVARRRWAVVLAIAALALASGVIGSLTSHAPAPASERAATGPFSYFPTQ